MNTNTTCIDCNKPIFVAVFPGEKPEPSICIKDWFRRQGETTDDVRAQECPFCEVHHDGRPCPQEIEDWYQNEGPGCDADA
jgi:hypothetical protein